MTSVSVNKNFQRNHLRLEPSWRVVANSEVRNSSFLNLGRLTFAFLVLIIWAPFSLARVFSYKDVTVGTMLRGSAGTVHIADAAYGKGMGDSTSFEAQPDYGLSGEFGLVFNGEFTNFVISGEYLTPTAMIGIEGKQNGSTKLMTVDSNVYAGIAWAGLEFKMRRRTKSQIIFGVYGGAVQATINNGVVMTSSGLTRYPSSDARYLEHATGFGYAGKALLGWEFLFTDNVTLMFEAGYRYGLVPLLTLDSDLQGVNGSAAKGAQLKNSDNSGRSLDLSGYFGGMNFRFYF